MATKYVATLGKMAKKIYQVINKRKGKTLEGNQEEIKALPIEKSPNIFKESMKLENFKTADKEYKIPDLTKVPVIEQTNIRKQVEMVR